MRTPKFKVGDKVRVLRASTDEEYDLWRDSWMQRMSYVIGKVMTIVYVDPNGNLCPKYRFKDTGLNFPEFVLEHEIKVSQQLLFSFFKR